MITIGLTPISSSVVTAGVYGSTNIASKTDLLKTIFSNGPQTWTVTMVGSTPVITSYDTSSVPLKNNGIIGQVLNWKYSGGSIWAGPNGGAFSGITLASLLGISTVNSNLIPAGVTDYSITAGNLFYTTNLGTFQAPVNIVAGTIGTPIPVIGGQVEAVTE